LEVVNTGFLPAVWKPLLGLAVATAVVGLIICILTALVKIAVVLLVGGWIAALLSGGFGGFSVSHARQLKDALAGQRQRLEARIAATKTPEAKTAATKIPGAKTARAEIPGAPDGPSLAAKLCECELKLCRIASRLGALEVVRDDFP
jgi:hypothetical protein